MQINGIKPPNLHIFDAFKKVKQRESYGGEKKKNLVHPKKKRRKEEKNEKDSEGLKEKTSKGKGRIKRVTKSGEKRNLSSDSRQSIN